MSGDDGGDLKVARRPIILFGCGPTSFGRRTESGQLPTVHARWNYPTGAWVGSCAPGDTGKMGAFDPGATGVTITCLGGGNCCCTERGATHVTPSLPNIPPEFRQHSAGFLIVFAMQASYAPISHSACEMGAAAKARPAVSAAAATHWPVRVRIVMGEQRRVRTGGAFRSGGGPLSSDPRLGRKTCTSHVKW
jgi:hypothetical protein